MTGNIIYLDVCLLMYLKIRRRAVIPKLEVPQPPPPKLCVDMGFTFLRYEDATVKLKHELISMKLK